MEKSEDRGIECKGVCFNYVDGNVTLKVYQNLPGITRKLAGTTLEKTFSKDEWREINRYLMGILDRVEEVFVDEDVEEEGNEPSDIQLSKMNNVPKMTEDDKEEIEEDKGDEELADVTAREGEGKDG